MTNWSFRWIKLSPLPLTISRAGRPDEFRSTPSLVSVWIDRVDEDIDVAGAWTLVLFCCEFMLVFRYNGRRSQLLQHPFLSGEGPIPCNIRPVSILLNVAPRNIPITSNLWASTGIIPFPTRSPTRLLCRNPGTPRGGGLAEEYVDQSPITTSH